MRNIKMLIALLLLPGCSPPFTTSAEYEVAESIGGENGIADIDSAAGGSEAGGNAAGGNAAGGNAAGGSGTASVRYGATCEEESCPEFDSFSLLDPPLHGQCVSYTSAGVTDKYTWTAYKYDLNCPPSNSTAYCVQQYGYSLGFEACL